MNVLFSDKTGTLTQGRISFMRAVSTDGGSAEDTLRFGLRCTETDVTGGQAVGGNPLDLALWESPAAAAHRDAMDGHRRLATLPFDHDRRLVSVLVADQAGRQILVTKGAPEEALARCTDVPTSARDGLAAEFEAGNRASRWPPARPTT